MKLLTQHTFNRFREAALRVDDIKLWKLYYAVGVVQTTSWIECVAFTSLPHRKETGYTRDAQWIDCLMFKRPSSVGHDKNPHYGERSLNDFGVIRNTYNDHLVFANEQLAREYLNAARKQLGQSSSNS